MKSGAIFTNSMPFSKVLARSLEISWRLSHSLTPMTFLPGAAWIKAATSAPVSCITEYHGKINVVRGSALDAIRISFALF